MTTTATRTASSSSAPTSPAASPSAARSSTARLCRRPRRRARPPPRPAGTAKTALVRAIAQAFGGRYFERLLTKFSTPEELFGPVSLKALEQDRYERVTTGKLPEAHFAFVGRGLQEPTPPS